MEPVKRKIRILLAAIPGMLVDIISEIVRAEPDLMLVDAVSASSDLGALVRRTRTDVVITQQASSLQEVDHTPLLFAGHPLKIVAITDDGRHGLLYELRPHCVPLGDLSADRLVAVIRTAAEGKFPAAGRTE